MKMKCAHRCIVNGDVVKPGTVLDLDEAKAKREPYLGSFVPLEKTDLSKPADSAGEESADEIVVAGLTRDQAIAKLRAAKQNVPGNISNAKLAERYEDTFAADAK